MIPFINPPHFDKGTIMAIGGLATITVQEGKNEEFERIFLELTEQVRQKVLENFVDDERKKATIEDK